MKFLRFIHSIIPNILALFTGARYLPNEFEFTWHCITHDIFRVYEFIFWRKKGFRCEAAQWIDENNVVHRIPYTLESRVRFFEDDVRAYFRALSSIKVEVYEAVLATAGMPIQMKIPYAFAIAFGGFAKLASSATPNSGSISTSGSDRFLIDFVCRNSTGQTISAAPTYNSVSSTLGVAYAGSMTAGYGANAYYLDDPATGSNTLSVAWTGGSNVFQYTLYYTGVVDNGISATYANEAAYSGTSRFQSITPSAANGWIAWFGSGDGSLPTGVYNSYGAYRTNTATDWCGADSNTTQAASAVSLGYTNSSGSNGTLTVLGFGISSGTTYTETYTETMVLVDTIPRSIVRTLIDVLALVDVITVLKIQYKELLESITLVDTITRSITAVRTEVLTLVDTIPRAITRTLSDVVTLVDTILQVRAIARTLSETITLVDSFLVNGTNVIWGHITKSAAAVWTKINRH